MLQCNSLFTVVFMRVEFGVSSSIVCWERADLLALVCGV